MTPVAPVAIPSKWLANPITDNYGYNGLQAHYGADLKTAVGTQSLFPLRTNHRPAPGFNGPKNSCFVERFLSAKRANHPHLKMGRKFKKFLVLVRSREMEIKFSL